MEVLKLFRRGQQQEIQPEDVNAFGNDEYPEDYGDFVYTVKGDDQSESDGPPCNVTKPIKECSENDFNKDEPPYLLEFDKGEFNTIVHTTYLGYTILIWFIF